MNNQVPLIARVAGFATWAAVGLAAAQSSQTPPTFRSSVDITQLDVSVLDRQHHPVRGLTAADFTVVEDGVPQTVATFQPFDIPAPSLPKTSWMREVAPDVAVNRPLNGRLVVVVVDDLRIRLNSMTKYWTEFWSTATSTRVADAVLDQIGPDDLTAVVYTDQDDRAQDFTTDRARIRQAISSFASRKPSMTFTDYAGSCGVVPAPPVNLELDELLRVTAALQAEPQRRKTILFVSPGMHIRVGPPTTCPQLLYRDLLRSAQRANINIYSIDPGAPPGAGVTAHAAELDDLQMLAESTGGRLIRDGKDDHPEKEIPGIFAENSSYYLLGFSSTNHAQDGAFRHIEIKVNRPDVEVRTRTGYYAAGGPTNKPSKKPTAPVSPLQESVTGLLPMTENPVRVSAAAFATAGKPGAAVALTVGVQQPAADARHKPMLSVVANAYDTNGESQASARTSVDLAGAADENGLVQYEVLLPINLSPGRYELRVGTETSGGQRGSVYTYVDVPNFAKEDLSLSGLLVERVPHLPVASNSVFATITSVVPTTVRQFTRTDHVNAFMRVYQGGRPMAAQVHARIENDRNEAVFDQTTPLGPERFADTHSADYRLALPIAGLVPSDYLFTVETTRGTKREERTLRFTVRD